MGEKGHHPYKRRDSLADQLGAPVYTGDPVPPFTAVMKNLIYISYRADPYKAQAQLPPGLTLVPGATITLAFFQLGSGFGISDCTIGFLAIAVNEHPAPDTSEAAYFAEGVCSEPACRLVRQHYGSFRPGGSEVTISEDGLIEARMWATDGGDIVRATLRASGPLQPQAANDRYIGRDDTGRLLASFTSVSGPNRPCDVLSLTFADSAPPGVRSLAPAEVLFGIHDPELLFCWSIPEPVERLAGLGAGQVALMEILDRQARGCAILSVTGQLLHGNSEALRLLQRLPAGRRDPLRLTGTAEQARLAAALAACATGPRDGQGARFLVGGDAGAGPLILHLMPSDPALAGPGSVLALISDPMEQGMLRDPGLLQLLGLTPAEARIASLVGTGLPPRQAAQSLGLAESTVRSSLKVIYDKLGVRRQAELVKIVMHLVP